VLAHCCGAGIGQLAQRLHLHCLSEDFSCRGRALAELLQEEEEEEEEEEMHEWLDS
jgi:hypothetical protein